MSTSKSPARKYKGSLGRGRHIIPFLTHPAMDDDNGLTEVADFAILARTQVANIYASIALVWFDYLLTFNGEIQQIWKRRLSWVTVLYHINRYSLLVSSVTLLIMQFHWSGLNDTNCTNLETNQKVLNVLVGICAAVFNGTRVSALYGRHWLLFTTTFLLGIAAPAINAYLWTQITPVDGYIIGAGVACGVDLGFISEDKYMNLMLGARVSSLAADSVVVYLTLAEGYKVWKVCRAFGRAQMFKLLVKEGILYYCLMMALNIIGIGLDKNPNVYAIIPPRISVLTSILISHFILELRSSFHASMQERSTTALDNSTIAFQAQDSEYEMDYPVRSSDSR